jgi:hypothetical protein
MAVWHLVQINTASLFQGHPTNARTGEFAKQCLEKNYIV